MTATKPLVLDVDGTFLRTDMLFETFWAGLGRDPFGVIGAEGVNCPCPMPACMRSLAVGAPAAGALVP